jgi:hypothetical protein
MRIVWARERAGRPKSGDRRPKSVNGAVHAKSMTIICSTRSGSTIRGGLLHVYRRSPHAGNRLLHAGNRSLHAGSRSLRVGRRSLRMRSCSVRTGNRFLHVGNHSPRVGNRFLRVGNHSLRMGNRFLRMGRRSLHVFCLWDRSRSSSRSRGPTFDTLVPLSCGISIGAG